MATIKTFVSTLGSIATKEDLKDRASSYYDALCDLSDVVGLQTDIEDLGHHLLDCADEADVQDNGELVDLQASLIDGVASGLASSLEAHGHFVADIAALAYGDSPERVEEAAIPLEWLAGVASALAVLQVPAEIKSLVDETVQRASMMLNIATVRRECSKKAPEAILSKWSDVWKMMQGISTTVGLADNHPLASLRMICNIIAMLDIEKPIVDFVEALANSDMCGAVTTSVMTTAAELGARWTPEEG